MVGPVIVSQDRAITAQTQQALPTQGLGPPPVVEDIAFPVAYTDPASLVGNASNSFESLVPVCRFPIGTAIALYACFVWFVGRIFPYPNDLMCQAQDLRGRAGPYRQRRMNQQPLAAVITDPPEPLHIAPARITLRA